MAFKEKKKKKILTVLVKMWKRKGRNKTLLCCEKQGIQSVLFPPTSEPEQIK